MLVDLVRFLKFMLVVLFHFEYFFRFLELFRVTEQEFEFVFEINLHSSLSGQLYTFSNSNLLFLIQLHYKVIYIKDLKFIF